MEESEAAAAAAAAIGPAPFLLKTYDMVDDSSTDDILSWSSSNITSFVVWNPPDFSRLLLPAYFKHNNFSSFIRQLNTYGFRKIDSERWEFANDDFVKGKKHLLRNIHRRKPIHSHSHSHPQGPIVDSERAAFDEEIERLLHERSCLEADILRSKQLCRTAKSEVEKVKLQVVRVEHRQEHLLSILEKAVQNEMFVQHLAVKLESMDFSAYNKKRRLPELPQNQQHQGSGGGGSVENEHPELFSTKLNLELSPAISDNNNTIDHTGCNGEVERRGAEEGCGAVFMEETSSGLGGKGRGQEGREEMCGEGGSEGHASCHLNLTLSSLPGRGVVEENRREEEEEGDKKASTLVSPLAGGGGRRGQVNDMFWEQFLTEKPGSSEEVCSRLRDNWEEEEDKWSTTTTNIRHLSL